VHDRPSRSPALALLAIALIGGACSPSPAPSGINGLAAVPSPPASVASATPTPVPSAIPAPGHELYGFVPYWEMDATIAAHVAVTPLTTLALFSVSTLPDGTVNRTQNGYRRIVSALGRQLIAEAHARGTRVELVYTSFGTETNATFFGNANLMETAVSELVAFVRSTHVDGINVDVEEFSSDLVPMYGWFLARLHESLVAMDAKAQLSVATTAGPLGAVMAKTAIDVGAERVFMMGYDYRVGGSEPGAESPILRSDGGDKSLTWSLDLYVAAGVPPERTYLGLPLYGMVWPVAGPVVGAPQTGIGRTWIIKQHVALLTNPSAAPILDPIEQVEVYFLGSDGSIGQPPNPTDGVIVPGSASPDVAASGTPGATGSAGPSATPGVTWQAVYVDSPATLAAKLSLANARGLVGAGFWAIGYERGLPAYTDLMRRFTAGDALP
jgi:hypothetical protein